VKTIVTGSAGYLGSVLVPFLREAGHRVVPFDSARYGLHCDFNVVMRDTADPFTWETLGSPDTDVVINLAALVGEPLCKKYPEESYRTNVSGTRLAAEWCNEHGAKLIQASTCSNYGVSEGLATEESPLKPLGVYASTKVASEEEAKKADEYTIFRFGTLYGPSPRMRWDTMINEWVYNCLYDGSLNIYNGSAYRPFLHVIDACRAINIALEKPTETRSQTFNVAGINITKAQLAGAIVGVVGGGWKLGGGEDKRDYRVDSSKFESAAGFSCIHTLASLSSDLDEIRLFALVRKTNNAKDFVMPHD